MVSPKLVAASSAPMVLSILAKEGESYGYAIIQRVRELSGGELHWTDGMLYPVLHRLEKQSFIESRWVCADSGRKRRLYRLSARGREALDHERKQWMLVHQTLSDLWKGDPCWT